MSCPSRLADVCTTNARRPHRRAGGEIAWTRHRRPGTLTTMTRTDVPTAWDERTVLTTLLDYTRATVHAKREGLSEEKPRKAPLPLSPLMTTSGLASHAKWVGYS